MNEVAPLATSQDGVWRLPKGEAYYRYAVRTHTGRDLDPADIHDFGLAEVERIQGQMQDIMHQVGYDGSLREFFDYVTTSDQFKYPDTDEGRETLLADNFAAMERIEALRPQYFNIVPEAAMEIRPVEEYRTATSSMASYSVPPPDGSRPGIYYLNLGHMDNFRTYNTEALFFHEAIPGHHFQLATAIESGDVPSFQRNLFVTAFSEGWGLYAERLAHDMGAYDSIYAEFGRLNYELWRAVRLVVDTGAHYHRWDLERVISYMRENTAISDGTIEYEARRYLLWPGQALSYKMGMTEILELRARAQETLGEDFDYGDFHDIVIGNGILTMEVLNRLVDDYIEANRND